jgi:hypothetical protein
MQMRWFSAEETSPGRFFVLIAVVLGSMFSQTMVSHAVDKLS